MRRRWKERWERLRRFAEMWVDRIAKILQDELYFSTTHRYLHFWVLVGKSFLKNRCPGRAGALAFSTVLALIPLMAVAISVTTGILQNQGKEAIHELTTQLVANIAPQLELVPKEVEGAESGQEQVVDQITDFVTNIQTGTLGVSGIVALLLVAISMINTIESTFNDIWGVEQGRGWLVRIVHYWSVLTLGPIILVTLVGITTVPYVERIQQWFIHVPLVGNLAGPLFRFVVSFFLFTLFYQFMPNTLVRWTAAVAGGVVGACLWQIYNSSNALFVSRVMREANIYGNFAVVPIFLLGMYLSWLILLFGGQVAYAYQNRHHYLQGKQTESINERGREMAGLRIMTWIAQRFHFSASPPTIPDLCVTLNLPDQLVRQICYKLSEAGLVHELVHPKVGGYFPSRPLNRVTAQDVLAAIRGPIDSASLQVDNPEPGYEVVRREYDRISAAEIETAREVTFAQLVEEMEGSD